MRQTEIVVRDIVFAAYPEFDFSEEGLLLNLNKLALHFVGRFGSGISEPEIVSFFELINTICEIGDAEIDDIVHVGFLEILTDTKRAQEYAQRHLRGNAHRLFNKLFEERFWKLTP